MNSIKSYQSVIYDEICAHKLSRMDDVSGTIISLPMGYGKTYLSYYGILKDNFKGVSLIICSKTLIGNWISELEKFGFDIEYEILHSSYISNISSWTPKPETKIIITTPEVVSKSYKENNVSEIFKRKKVELTGLFADGNTDYYFLNPDPYGIFKEGEPLIHSMRFERLIIDEFHNYTSIKTRRSQALASICANDTWLLSGTPFQEVDYDRVLGTLLLLRHKRYRDVGILIQMMKYRRFPGFNTWSVIRKDKTPPGEILPELVIKIDSFNLSEKEDIIYRSLRDIIKILYDKYKEIVESKDKDLVLMKKVSGNLLAMITYLRQSLIIPQIAIVKMISKMNNLDSDEIVGILNNVLERYQLKEWIETEESLLSSRVLKLLEIISLYPSDKIIVFSNFVEGLDIVKSFVEQKFDHTIFSINSKMTMEKRRNIIDDYNKTTNPSIMFLSYSIGSEGLNLQSANVVINLDFYWNQGKENQALSRMYRIGQKNSKVYQHILVSNTGIEKSILEKKRDKLIAIDDIMTSGHRTIKKISNMSFVEIAKIISIERSREIISDIYF